MICLADMPLLKSEDYNSMVQFEEKFRNKSKIIVPYNKTTRGNLQYLERTILIPLKT